MILLQNFIKNVWQVFKDMIGGLGNKVLLKDSLICNPTTTAAIVSAFPFSLFSPSPLLVVCFLPCLPPPPPAKVQLPQLFVILRGIII